MPPRGEESVLFKLSHWYVPSARAASAARAAALSPFPVHTELLESRRAARERKDWAESDRLRDALDGLGVEVSDGRQGTTWRLRR